MSRLVLYVAHPLSPTQEEIAAAVRETGCYRGEAAPLALRRNLDRAMRWLAWLHKGFPETTFIAPWIAAIMSGEDDADPETREAGLVDDCAVVERCDGIVLCGGRISSGMRRESAAGRFPSHWVCDFAGLGAEPPGPAPAGLTFAAYVDALRGAVRP